MVYEFLNNVRIEEYWLLIASWVGVLLSVALPHFYAFSIFRRLHETTSAQYILKEIKIPGRAPIREDAIEKQRVRKKNGLQRHMKGTFRTVAKIVGVGIVLPLLLLVLITTQSQWFFMDLPVLIDAATTKPVYNPDYNQLSLFFLDQFLKGSLNDLVEVFQFDLAHFFNFDILMITNNPQVLYFSLSVFVFRMIVGVYAIALFLYIAKTIFLRNYLGAKVTLAAKFGSLGTSNSA